MKPRRCEYGVTVHESVPSYPSGTHEIAVLSFGAIGAETIEAAEEQGRTAAARLVAHKGRTHRFEVQRFCQVCACSGVMPGKKRVPCIDCGGAGAIALLSGRETAAAA